MQRNAGNVARPFVACLFLLVCLTNWGCRGLMGHLGYWTGGSMIQPDYDGLEGHRVAVVCVSATSAYGNGVETDRLSRQVRSVLGEKVKDIEVVAPGEIADWVDKNGWDEIDYREVGRGVRAERVVAIDLEEFRLHEGPTLYKGRSNLTVTVFDMADGEREVFRRTLSDVKFPVTGVYHATDMTESKFRDLFIGVLARQVARHFFAYDALDESAYDMTVSRLGAN